MGLRNQSGFAHGIALGVVVIALLGLVLMRVYTVQQNRSTQGDASPAPTAQGTTLPSATPQPATTTDATDGTLYTYSDLQFQITVPTRWQELPNDNRFLKGRSIYKAWQVDGGYVQLTSGVFDGECPGGDSPFMYLRLGYRLEGGVPYSNYCPTDSASAIKLDAGFSTVQSAGLGTVYYISNHFDVCVEYGLCDEEEARAGRPAYEFASAFTLDIAEYAGGSLQFLQNDSIPKDTALLERELLTALRSLQKIE